MRGLGLVLNEPFSYVLKHDESVLMFGVDGPD